MPLNAYRTNCTCQSDIASALVCGDWLDTYNAQFLKLFVGVFDRLTNLTAAKQLLGIYGFTILRCNHRIGALLRQQTGATLSPVQAYFISRMAARGRLCYPIVVIVARYAQKRTGYVFPAYTVYGVSYSLGSIISLAKFKQPIVLLYDSALTGFIPPASRAVRDTRVGLLRH